MLENKETSWILIEKRKFETQIISEEKKRSDGVEKNKDLKRKLVLSN